MPVSKIDFIKASYSPTLLREGLKGEPLALSKFQKLFQSNLLNKQELAQISQSINALKSGNDSVPKSNALVLDGLMHQYAQKYPEAIRLYEEAIELGNANAMTNRAFMHLEGIGGSIDYKAAITLYDKAIQLGAAYAMTHRAIMHQDGEGGPIDYKAAITLYDKVIELGNTHAMNNRAIMHQNGEGGPIDYKAAITLYDKAIQLGNTYAMNNRARMHFKGQGGPIDYKAAITLLNKAIRLGDATAMNSRAFMHQNGKGGPVNNRAAIELYIQANNEKELKNFKEDDVKSVRIILGHIKNYGVKPNEVLKATRGRKSSKAYEEHKDAIIKSFTSQYKDQVDSSASSNKGKKIKEELSEYKNPIKKRETPNTTPKR